MLVGRFVSRGDGGGDDVYVKMKEGREGVSIVERGCLRNRLTI